MNTVGRISLSPPDPSGFLSPESAGPDPVASSFPQAVSKASQTAELPLQTCRLLGEPGPEDRLYQQGLPAISSQPLMLRGAYTPARRRL